MLIQYLFPARRVVLVGSRELRTHPGHIARLPKNEICGPRCHSHPRSRGEDPHCQDQFRREHQHRVVERELGFRGRALLQDFNTLRNHRYSAAALRKTGPRKGEDGRKTTKVNFIEDPRECDEILSRARSQNPLGEIRTPEPEISCVGRPDELQALQTEDSAMNDFRVQKPISSVFSVPFLSVVKSGSLLLFFPIPRSTHVR